MMSQWEVIQSKAHAIINRMKPGELKIQTSCHAAFAQTSCCCLLLSHYIHTPLCEYCQACTVNTPFLKIHFGIKCLILKSSIQTLQNTERDPPWWNEHFISHKWTHFKYLCFKKNVLRIHSLINKSCHSEMAPKATVGPWDVTRGKTLPQWIN